MPQGRLAILSVSDASKDPRILKQAAVFAEDGWQIRFFSRVPGSTREEVSTPLGRTSIYPQRLFPKTAALLYRRFSKTRPVDDTANNLISLDQSEIALISPTGLAATKAALIDRRYLRALPAAMARDVRNWKPDLIQGHDLPGGNLARILAKSLDVPYIYDAHEFETDRHAALPETSWNDRRHLERTIARSAAAMTTVSDLMAERHQTMYGICRPTVLYNAPVSLPEDHKTTRSTLRADLSISTDTPLVVHIGSYRPGRGYGAMISAVAGLSGVHLAFVGVPPDSVVAGAINAEASAKNAAERIHCYGPVTQASLLNTIKDADASLIATENSCLNHDFSMPNKLFESMLASLPIVVAPNRAMAKMVETLGIGSVSSSHEAAALRLALRTTLEREQSFFYPKETRRRIQSEYSWEAQATKLKRLLIQLQN